MPIVTVICAPSSSATVVAPVHGHPVGGRRTEQSECDDTADDPCVDDVEPSGFDRRVAACPQTDPPEVERRKDREQREEQAGAINPMIME